MKDTRSIRIIAQHARRLNMESPVRPYEVKAPGENRLRVTCKRETLPEENHWRVTCAVSTFVANPEGDVRLEADVELEAVCLIEGVESREEAEALLLRNVLPSMYGSARSFLTSLTVPSGHAAIIIPPVTADQLVDMVLKE